MINLVIDTSNKFLYLAFLSNNEILIEKIQEGNNNHSEKLLDVLSSMTKEINIVAKDIDNIYVGKGPGSYTGVRVASTVAKVLAHAMSIPLYSFSSLDFLLSSYLDQNGKYVVHMDARRGGAFAKVVEITDGKIVYLLDEIYIPFEELNQMYPDAIYIDQNDPKYDITRLLKHGLYKRVDDLHAFVPTYLRSGV